MSIEFFAAANDVHGKLTAIVCQQRADPADGMTVGEIEPDGRHIDQVDAVACREPAGVGVAEDDGLDLLRGGDDVEETLGIHQVGGPAVNRMMDEQDRRRLVYVSASPGETSLKRSSAVHTLLL